MKLSQYVAQALKENRKERHLSQAEVARALRVAQNTVCRWETGAYSISLDDLEGIAALFGVPVSDLLPRETTPVTLPEALAKLDKALALVKRIRKGEHQ